MPQIRFIKPWRVIQGDGKGPEYAVGDVVDLERSYAEKYVRRGLAKTYVVPTAAPEPASAATEIVPSLVPPEADPVSISETTAPAAAAEAQPSTHKRRR